MDVRERMLGLLRRFGWNATSFQALEPSFEYWFREDGEGALAFFDTGSAWVCAGPPVADVGLLSTTTRQFATEADRAGRRVVFFAVEERFLEAIALEALPIGLQPRWNPQEWNERHRGHRSFKEQLRRARAKGVTVERLHHEALDASRAPIQALIDRWLKHRSMPPMSFLVEISPFTFAHERRYYLARQGTAVVGILVAVPVYQRQGWFFEDVLRDPAAPNGTAESLIDFAMRDVARDGATFVTLGLAPLAGEVRWHRMVRVLTSGLYNFDGLYAFKSKLRPDAWDPIYVAWPSKVSRVAAVYDVLDAFAGGKLVRFGLRTIFRAPAVVLFTLGVLALPWAWLVAGVDTERWFPSRRVQIAWSVFDLAMGAALVALACRWRHPLAQAACAAAATDAVVTSIEAASYNLRRVRGWRDLAVIAVAIAAPVTVAAILTGGLRRR